MAVVGDERGPVVFHGAVIRALVEGFLDLEPDRMVPDRLAYRTVLRSGKPNGRRNIPLEPFDYWPAAPVFNGPTDARI
jgi:hypothetical protein